MKKNLDRRDFLKGAALLGAGATLPVHVFAQERSPKAVGANDLLRIAVCGVKGRGLAHIGEWTKMKDVQVAAIVDIDENVIHDGMSRVEKAGGAKPVYYQDWRKMLEDKSIDAMSVATCNHTHTLLSLTGCQAGKHVYVEKPLSHNVWEGRKLVEAARKYGRVVQHGTQSRSSGALRRALGWAQGGALGKIKVSRGLCYKLRPSIKHTPEEPVPPGVNYDLWLGPAPLRPFTKNRFHYNWHWHWDYGNGDIGNQGVHEIDIARWALGKNELPKKVISIGGRFGYEDDGETPNTQIALFDYGDSILIFEVRGLPTEGYKGVKVGDVIHCEKGYLVGPKAFDADGKEIKVEGPDAPGGDHFRNFIDTVKGGRREDQRADVLEGHLSASLCHLANVSYRLGEKQGFSKKDPFGSYSDGNETFERMCAHLKAEGVDLDRAQLQVGKTLSIDTAAETIVGDSKAAGMLTREYRKPYVVPDQV
ncbi:MAG TPA: Gfo/Idh/MocA family oxidoreductase [Planctomycetota bacterium]|nr:Gfo/Idh/MocA family oxidoreductase [Planctomycetota bacterium]